MLRYSHHSIEVARALRQRQTLAEKLLWKKVRRHQLCGLKFKRQHRLGRYIVDFYCAELRLVVELEGLIHERPEQQEYDSTRFEEIETRGFNILRIRNEDVVNDIEKVLEKILTFLPSPPGPSPNVGRGVSRSDGERVEG